MEIKHQSQYKPWSLNQTSSNSHNISYRSGGCRGRDGMLVGFTITYASSAYRHIIYDFESRSWRGVQYKFDTTIYVIESVSYLRQVGSFLRILRFSPPIGVKHHNPIQVLLVP